MALRFTNGNDLIVTADGAIPQAGCDQFSMSVRWYKDSVSDFVTSTMLCGGKEWGWQDEIWEFNTSQSGGDVSLRFVHYFATTDTAHYGNITYSRDEWHDAAMSYDRISQATPVIYCDGDRQTFGTDTAGVGARRTKGGGDFDVDTLVLSDNASGGRPFAAGDAASPGQLCEWGMWDRALSEEELSALSLGLLPGQIPNGLIFYLRGQYDGQTCQIPGCGLTYTDGSGDSLSTVAHPGQLYVPSWAPPPAGGSTKNATGTSAIASNINTPVVTLTGVAAGTSAITSAINSPVATLSGAATGTSVIASTINEPVATLQGEASGTSLIASAISQPVVLLTGMASGSAAVSVTINEPVVTLTGMAVGVSVVVSAISEPVVILGHPASGTAAIATTISEPVVTQSGHLSRYDAQEPPPERTRAKNPQP